MNRMTYLGLVALSLGACATDPTGPAPSFGKAGATSGGVSNPGITINAVFTVAYQGAIVYRESGPGNNGKGECLSEGRWYNPQNHHTSEKAHPQCATVTGGTITVTFTESANYVTPPNGNVQLNFTPDCALSPDPVACGRALQYKKNQDLTTGAGSLQTTDVDGRLWTINFAQAMLNDSGNLINPAGTVLEACNASLGCWPGSMTW